MRKVGYGIMYVCMYVCTVCIWINNCVCMYACMYACMYVYAYGFIVVCVCMYVCMYVCIYNHKNHTSATATAPLNTIRRMYVCMMYFCTCRPVSGQDSPAEQPRQWVESNLSFGGFIAFECKIRADSEIVVRSLLQADHKVHTYIHTYIHTYCYSYLHTYIHTYIHTALKHAQLHIHTSLHGYLISDFSIFIDIAVAC